ncbi:MAG: class I SAM-dependent methyltransferase [Actinomycetota bacterium]
MFQRRKQSETPSSVGATDWRSYDEVAETYDRVRSPVHQPPARDLVTAVDPVEGSRLLDVGTGPGLAAMSFDKGLAVGVDLAPGMARVARARGLHTVAVAAAIDLPFADETFDTVVSAFLLHLVPKYETALFDMSRVLKRGGRLGLATWVAADDEFTRTWREIAESFATKEMLEDARRKAAPWAERFSDPAQIEDILRRAGFRDIRVEKRTYRSEASIEDYLTGRETTAIGRFLKEMLGSGLWERFRERVDAAYRSSFRDPIGDTNDVLITVATRER